MCTPKQSTMKASTQKLLVEDKVGARPWHVI